MKAKLQFDLSSDAERIAFAYALHADEMHRALVEIRAAIVALQKNYGPGDGRHAVNAALSQFDFYAKSVLEAME